MSKAQRDQALAKSMADTASHFQKFADAERTLLPPSSYVDLRDTMAKCYQAEADEWRKWSMAVARNDRAGAEKVSDEMDRVEVEIVTNMRDALEKVAPGAEKLDATIAQLKAETDTQFPFNQPMPTKPRVLNKVDYVDQWAKYCYAYCRVAKEEGHAPTPKPNQSREDYFRQGKIRLTAFANKMDDLARREELTVPPREYEGLHQASITFYRTQGQNWREFAKLIGNKPTKTGLKFVDDMADYPEKQIALMRAEAKKTQSDAALEQELTDMERSNPLRPSKPTQKALSTP